LDENRATWGKECASIVSKYRKAHPDISSDKRAYPRISEFGKLPYLYTAAATFLMAVNELEAALKLLEYADQDIKKQHINSKVGAHVDYGFLIRLAQVQYYQGRPAAHLAELYDKMRQVAATRRIRLRQHCDLVGCNESKKVAIKEMIKRHRAAEIAAMNEFAYSVAEELARGIETATPFEVRMVLYAKALKDIVGSDELRSIGLVEEEHNYIDTYAYAMIVAEARKSSPDIGVFKQMRRLLQDVVAKFEQNARDTPTRDAFQALNAARIHYQSARELAGD
jgi:hypothetical protein